MEALAELNPVLIIDEPHRFEGAQTQTYLARFKPLLTLRFGATFRNDQYLNLIYTLDSVNAFKQRLVKGITVHNQAVQALSLYAEPIMPVDSDIERTTVDESQLDSVTVFAKLPRINIPTPLGKKYNPDFGYAVHRQGDAKALYLVVETKGYDNRSDIEEQERFKIETCPCGKSNKDGKFVPFEGYKKFGFCHSCAKTIFPEESKLAEVDFIVPIRSKPEPLYIPMHYLIKSIRRFDNNKFLHFLQVTFGIEKTNKVIEMYKIGDAKTWFGSTIFWQIDKNNNVRTGKIMLYNKNNGKRVKKPYEHINWVHSKLNIANDKIDKCFFGEHLLNHFPDKTIAIVESEKTAIIASFFFPNLIWMATGGISNLSYSKLKSLIGRKIILFPDLCAYDKWLQIIQPLDKWFKITVSDYLEKNASSEEKLQKYDLADYLLALDRSKFFGFIEAT
jgi:hypothetical protein